MPRSYSFDHYQVPKKDTHLMQEQEKAQYTESKAAEGEPKIHYGKAHAETEEFLAARRMNAQLEDLAGMKADEAPRQEKQAPAKKAPRAVNADAKMAALRKEQPIGALPAKEDLPNGEGLGRQVLELATSQMKLVRTAARDLGSAGLRLVRLPLDVATLAARRINPRKA